MPNIMGNVRMGGTEFKTLNDDMGESTCYWWIWFGVWSNVANTKGL